MITIRLGTLSGPGHSQLTPMAPGPEAQAQKREVCVTGIWQQHPENQNGHEVSLHCALKLPHENVLATRNLLGNLWTTAKLQINAFSLSTSWFWESHHPLPPGHWGRQRSVMFYKTNWRKCKASAVQLHQKKQCTLSSETRGHQILDCRSYYVCTYAYIGSTFSVPWMVCLFPGCFFFRCCFRSSNFLWYLDSSQTQMILTHSFYHSTEEPSIT